MPLVDFINSPFILNYAEDIESLRAYLRRLFLALNTNGKLALVIDVPSGANLEKFGAKKILERDEDGAPMSIELSKDGVPICTLHATYFKKATILRILEEVGFENVVEWTPIISDEGLSEKGEDFWVGYTDNCELSYITADKL